ncbi:MAG: hypothetical protein L6R38_004669 [Xanthoria sp. 2 TBL-2021]|nr:MAG: hypothetical protein L6R38_004669 [Xanthoria sp. 2 TBL-2021]
MDKSSSSDRMDLTSSQPNSPSEESPDLSTYWLNSGRPRRPEECWDLDIELDYDDSKISEEERQLIRDAYAGIDVNARDYVTRVPEKGPNTATSGQEPATQQGSKTVTSSQDAVKNDKGMHDGAQSTAVANNTDEIEKKCQERMRRMRISDE